MGMTCFVAAFDSQMMLIHNTLWARRFFRQAAKIFDDPSAVEEVQLRITCRFIATVVGCVMLSLSESGDMQLACTAALTLLFAIARALL